MSKNCYFGVLWHYLLNLFFLYFRLQSDVSANTNLVPGTVSTSQSRQSFKSIAGSDITDSKNRDYSRYVRLKYK